MRSYAKASVEVPAVNGVPVVIDIPSSNGKKIYHVDLTNGRCSCPAWVFQNKTTGRRVCKHLDMLGYKEI